MSPYFRNRVAVVSIEGIAVDAGSLWKWESGRNLLVLEDEDQDVTIKLGPEPNFENCDI